MSEPVRITKYSNLADDELLARAEDARPYSPLIEELCQRLQKSSLVLGSEVNHRAECPVCEAQLHIDYDEANHMFEVRIEE